MGTYFLQEDKSSLGPVKFSSIEIRNRVDDN